MTASENKSIVRTCVTCGLQVDGGETSCPNDGSLLSTGHIDPLLGTILVNKYEIKSVLGRGGMSAVYKARHILMDRWVALKVLKQELVNDPLMLQRFQIESKAASSLKHANVITVFDFGVTPDNIPYLVMDYLEGRDVATIIDEEGQLSPARCVNLFVQACNALNHAHNKGVIHRDIKPGNLLVLSEDGVETLKVVDFGIAKMLATEGVEIIKLTTTGLIFGSPAYMSPEQCHGMRVDGRSDMYSLGLVIYECLTGNPALKGNSTIDMIMKQVQDSPVTFEEIRPDLQIPQTLQDVVFKALNKDPEKRYANMAEFGAALQQSMVGVSEQVSAPPSLQIQGSTADLDITKTRPTVFKTPPAVASETASPSAAEAKVEADRASRQADAVPSMSAFSLFGDEQILPAASDSEVVSEPIRHEQAQSPQSLSGDKGAIFLDKQGDSGQLFSATDLGGDVGNLFGYDKLLPAVSDHGTSLVETDKSTALVTYNNNAQRDSSGASGIQDPPYTQGNTQNSSRVGSGTAGAAAGAAQPANPIRIIGYAAGGLALVVLAACGFLASGGSSLLDKNPQLAGFFHRDSGKETPAPVAQSAVKTAHQIYEDCMPSVVTLSCINIDTEIAGTGKIEITDTNGKPILVQTTNGKMTLLDENGKPADTVHAVLNGKVPAAITLAKGTPIVAFKDAGKVILSDKLAVVAKGKTVSRGTGFFIKPGFVITNYSVVAGNMPDASGFSAGLAQLANSQAMLEIPGPPVAADRSHDLALLYVPGSHAPPLDIRPRISTLQVGDPCYALGSPLNQRGTMMQGTISADRLRDGLGGEAEKLYLQHDIKIDKLANGGPLVDNTGQVIGVNDCSIGQGAVNLAVASTFAQEMLDQPEVQKKMKDLVDHDSPDLNQSSTR